MTDLERMLMVSLKTEERMEKIASNDPIYAAMAITLTGLLGATVIDAIRDNQEARAFRRNQQASWYKLTTKYPEFGEDPEAASNFHAIFQVSPEIGSVPQFVAPILRQARSYGTEGFPIDTVRSLQSASQMAAQSRESYAKRPGSATRIRNLMESSASEGAKMMARQISSSQS
jgi:hypothetical protein